MRALLALLATGCIGGSTFHCTGDAECAPGTCEATGVCSFADGECPSGKRYGELSGELAGECVALAAQTSPTPDAGVDASIPDAPPPPPAPYTGDDFEGPSLDPRWSTFGGDVVDVGVSGGKLVLVPTARQVWYQAQRGGLVHQSLTGDVRVTARISVRSQVMPAQPPANDIHLAGIMARDPGTIDENYVFIGVGRLGGLSVEIKSTDDSSTTLDNPSWPVAEAELRLCRLGATFHLYKRPFAGGPWQTAGSFARADLPATLQVGLFVSADSAPPDLRALVEEVRLVTPATLADCAAE
jgi:hypothetical protein